MKLVDPTLPFAGVVARRRREGAGAAAAIFGLWASTHDWRTLYPEPTAVAGIGASEPALRAPEVDLTQRLIGASAGLLVDLGFQVCPIGAITSGDVAGLTAGVGGRLDHDAAGERTAVVVQRPRRVDRIGGRGRQWVGVHRASGVRRPGAVRAAVRRRRRLAAHGQLAGRGQMWGRGIVRTGNHGAVPSTEGPDGRGRRSTGVPTRSDVKA